MSDVTRFVIGSRVVCSDGVCGVLRRVVVDPVSRALTHLAVEPQHGSFPGHLVPIELVTSSDTEIRLDCTSSDFAALEEADETQLLPGPSAGYGYEQEEMYSWPYFRLGGTGAMGMRIGADMHPGPHEVVSDHVPVGEAEVRRGEAVHATDGDIGHVRGLVVEPDDHHVTHVLLEEGHLWGHKTVAIPIAAVRSVDDGVRLSLSKDEVKDLPGVDIEHPGAAA